MTKCEMRSRTRPMGPGSLLSPFSWVPGPQLSPCRSCSPHLFSSRGHHHLVILGSSLPYPLLISNYLALSHLSALKTAADVHATSLAQGNLKQARNGSQKRTVSSDSCPSLSSVSHNHLGLGSPCEEHSRLPEFEEQLWFMGGWASLSRPQGSSS